MPIGLYGPEYLQFDDGGPAAEVRIFVFLPGTKTKAVLWSDKNGLYTRDNPLWTDRNGELVFYAEQGEYDLYYEHMDTTITVQIDQENAPTPNVYVHTQSEASDLWVISHFLGARPTTIIEENTGFPDDVSFAAVRYPDLNHTEIRWGYAASGRVTCRR